MIVLSFSSLKSSLLIFLREKILLVKLHKMKPSNFIAWTSFAISIVVKSKMLGLLFVGLIARMTANLGSFFFVHVCWYKYLSVSSSFTTISVTTVFFNVFIFHDTSLIFIFSVLQVKFQQRLWPLTRQFLLALASFTLTLQLVD